MSDCRDTLLSGLNNCYYVQLSNVLFGTVFKWLDFTTSARKSADVWSCVAGEKDLLIHSYLANFIVSSSQERCFSEILKYFNSFGLNLQRVCRLLVTRVLTIVPFVEKISLSYYLHPLF